MSNDTKGYNGWTNYETWCVHLWLSNGEGSYRYWQEEAERHQAEAPTLANVRLGLWTAQQAARYTLGEAIKESFETFHPFRGEHLAKPLEADVYTDLLDSALSEVRWSEIAEAFLEEFEAKDDTDPDGEQSNEPEAAEGPKQDQTEGPNGPRFELGRVVSTPGALKAVTRDDITTALARHYRGDWGDVGPVDWSLNDEALEAGGRVLSVYYGIDGAKFWVITEADRSATTILLPDEY